MKKTLIASAAIALSIALSAGTAQASAHTHTVINNDTFWKLSLQYKVPMKKIMDANAWIDPLNMQTGMKVKIPGVSKVTSNSQNSPTIIPTGKTVTAASGEVLSYSKQLSVKATAYTAAASENGKWGAVDYFGNKLKVGTIAVDSKMIPLGTKLYITGYDYNGLPSGGMIATATDMGGSIKGNRIDIFVPGTTQQASKFGIQNVTAYILK
ncbi:3D domain-containing protein [Paenibacillus sp. GSMTC-2017]|uniref:3D domain-containing protein n=1 Tax=Paenibacillus sp. GSMTC-2017 TaxID=2794350 RepID=UPI001E408C0C|nr:3D domain-containing protein [Paenibacillus sp. GSMTC-2017]